jgi:hypothetical protein
MDFFGDDAERRILSPCVDGLTWGKLEKWDEMRWSGGFVAF